MRARRVAASVAAAVVLMGLGIVGATPAPAADVGTFTGCVDGTVVWALDGTVVLVYDDEECTLAGTELSGRLEYTHVTVDGDVCWTLTWTAGDGDGRFFGSSGSVVTFAESGSTTAVPAVCGDPARAAALPIPDWVQAYARTSADAPCIDGWTPSWGQWPNGGTGGWVCTRSIPSLG